MKRFNYHLRFFFLTKLCLAIGVCGGTDLSFAESQDRLVDRLIVEIDNISYTQRQMESYIFMVDLLSGQAAYRVANSSNWLQIRAVFVDDMIIEQEALRLGGYEPNRKMIDQAKGLVKLRESQDSALSPLLQDLGLEKTQLERTVAQALRVEGFKRSKQRQAAVIDNRKEATIHLSTKFSSWQRDLNDRAIIRFFKNSDAFAKLATHSSTVGPKR